MMKLMRSSVLILLSLSTLSCTSVKPWERGNLARPEMAFTTDGLGKKIQDHINHSKEGSSSVTAGSGGGCGCN